jgi:Ser/Thr protein kinase RdoA (MazF antagonist)
MPGPAEQVLSWAADAVTRGARIVGVTGLRESANPWLLRFDLGGKTSEAILKVGDVTSVQQREQFGTAVPALVLAEERALAAPRLIAADLDGSAAGTMAMLTTVLPGSSKIPRVASAGRLRTLGAAAATLHAIPLSPRAGLPLRTRPLSDVDFAAWRRSAGTTGLLATAEERLGDIPVPDSATVFVHGDLWQGNTMWSDGSCTGIIDWDCAGAGPSGIDLSSLRFDAALYYGLPPAGEILDGWRQATGRQEEHLAYWDVVAALCTVADMTCCMPPLQDHGRSDLDGHTLTTRRDAFLSTALDQLGRA